MNENYKKAGALAFVTLYGVGLYQSGFGDKVETLNEGFDAAAALITAVSGVTGSASYIDMTPHTVVDKQYFNVDADFASSHDIEEQT